MVNQATVKTVDVGNGARDLRAPRYLRAQGCALDSLELRKQALDLEAMQQGRPAKIIHVDADCFYAAVEARDNPRLRGRPIAVGGDPNGRGVVATCSYAARRHGVRSAMSSALALKLCSDLEFIRPNMKKYKAASENLNQILKDYSDELEPLSLDEAYLDVSDTGLCSGSATLIAKEIKARVLKEVGITVSAGVAPIKFLAKVASDWLKPNGLFVILPEQVQAFTADLNVARLPGVGPATLKRLHRRGLYRCRDIRAIGETTMGLEFGQFGVELFQRAWGIDSRTVRSRAQRKSMSVERTFAQDLNPSEFPAALTQLQQELSERLRKKAASMAINKLCVKLKFNDFQLSTAESGIPESVKAQWISELAAEVKTPSELLKTDIFTQYQRLCSLTWGRVKKPIRLLGLGVGFSVQQNRGLSDDAVQIPLNPEW